MSKLSKDDKIFGFCVLPIMLLIMTAVLIWVINWTKIENQKRYKELPDISIVEEN